MSISISSDGFKEVDAFNPSYRIFNGNDFSAGTATGVGITTTSNTFGNSYNYLTTSVSGSSNYRYVFASNNSPISIGQPKGGINWAKGVRIATIVCRDTNPIDNAITFRLGYAKAGGGSGDLGAGVKGIGWKFTGSGALQCVGYNGTTLTASTNGTYFFDNSNAVKVIVESDGLGNVKLYVNDVLSASCTGAPTSGTGSTSQNYMVVDMNSAGTPANASSMLIGQVHLQTDI